MKHAFTLIELLVIIAIMGTMVTVGIVSVRQGKSRSQLAGAARDIMAVVRQARSIALITQKPAVITYSNSVEDEDSVIKISVKAEKLFDDDEDVGVVRDLEGEIVAGLGEDMDAKQGRETGLDEDGAADGLEDAKGGETLNEVLMPEISKDLTKGLRIRVLKEDEQLEVGADRVYKSSISIFSNVAYIKATVGEKPAVAEKKASGTVVGGNQDADVELAASATEAPVEIVWEANGRTTAHTIWIYADGAKPEEGLSLEVDKFGEVRVSQWKDED